MNAVLAAQGTMSMGVIVIVYALLFGGLYFFLIRPQRKEQKRVQGMISSLEDRRIRKQQKLPYPDAESSNRAGGKTRIIV